MRTWAAYAVHVYTASGILPVLLAAVEIASDPPSPVRAFLWLALATVIDATDGPLARRFRVSELASSVRGRTLDDIIDYLSFTFLPLLLLLRMGWVAEPAWLFCGLAMMASLFGFANVGAKEDALGFFVGFPSYWNVAVFYLGIWAARFGPFVPTLVVVLLAALTVVPVRFVYPNRAPSPWRTLLIAGGWAWLVVLLLLLPRYPLVPIELACLSLLYPLFYVAVSWHLSRRASSSTPGS